MVRRNKQGDGTVNGYGDDSALRDTRDSDSSDNAAFFKLDESTSHGCYQLDTLHSSSRLGSALMPIEGAVGDAFVQVTCRNCCWKY